MKKSYKRLGLNAAGVASVCVLLAGCSTKDKPSILAPREYGAGAVPAPYLKPRAAEVQVVTRTEVVAPVQGENFETASQLPSPVFTETPVAITPEETAPVVFEIPQVADIEVVDNDPVVEGETYTVQKGDSLWKISRKFSVSVAEISSVNGISKDTTLKIGQELTIPGADATHTEVAMSATTEEKAKFYTVKRGDTLSEIAQTTGLSSSELMSMNGLSNPNKIFIGQKLALNGPAAEESKGKVFGQVSIPKTAIPSNGEHIVKKNESLWTIAYRYSLTVNKLKAYNGLTRDTLYKGQVLKLRPSDGSTATSVSASAVTSSRSSQTIPVDGFYTVQSNDSLWTISRKFGVSMDDIREANPNMKSILQPGDRLIISKDAGDTGQYSAPKLAGQPSTPPVAAQQSVATEGTDDGVGLPVETAGGPATGGNIVPETMLPHYVDKANDTLEGVASLYDSKVDWILEVNPGVKSDADLRAKSEIQVPVKDMGLTGN
ncbi:MAG: LysM peptidoglycan-binding domain-containing protein [Lentisphaeria bacterium]|nr:LysM peptidoglycan-binding domain-containing protein [Lentisphaeria bacterium]